MHEKSLSRGLKRGTLEMILLKLLSPQPMYGYELIAALEKKGGARDHLGILPSAGRALW